MKRIVYGNERESILHFWFVLLFHSYKFTYNEHMRARNDLFLFVFLFGVSHARIYFIPSFIRISWYPITFDEYNWRIMPIA